VGDGLEGIPLLCTALRYNPPFPTAVACSQHQRVYCLCSCPYNAFPFLPAPSAVGLGHVQAKPPAYIERPRSSQMPRILSDPSDTSEHRFKLDDDAYAFIMTRVRVGVAKAHATRIATQHTARTQTHSRHTHTRTHLALFVQALTPTCLS
jgi:hypothetical protein